MMTIALDPEIETRLKGEAARRGIDAAEYAQQLLAANLPARPATPPARDQATLDILDAWERETATDDAEELARRQAEFEEFKLGMNRNRLEMEGPHARKVYP